LKINIDVGKKNKKIMDEKMYVGMSNKRVKGDDYEKFIDEFMEDVVKRYGKNNIIKFEEFGKKNELSLLDK
jgi:malate dehydrogenase (oxaloacetate-decarboxylating)(NADP+)